eukprot:6461516-Amphidinium_carterae.1
MRLSSHAVCCRRLYRAITAFTGTQRVLRVKLYPFSGLGGLLCAQESLERRFLLSCLVLFFAPILLDSLIIRDPFHKWGGCGSNLLDVAVGPACLLFEKGALHQRPSLSLIVHDMASARDELTICRPSVSWLPQSSQSSCYNDLGYCAPMHLTQRVELAGQNKWLMLTSAEVSLSPA